jgi:hypothetical protein
MPILENPVYESICQDRAKGMGPLEAYVKGGFKPHAPNASKFFKKPFIVERIKEIQDARI